MLDVFTEDGEYLGRMELPIKVDTLSPPPRITADHIDAVFYDEFDVPFIVRWRIVKP